MNQNRQIKSFYVWGMRVDIVQIPEVLKFMQEWIKSKNYGNYINISNINDAVESRKDLGVKEAVNKSSLSVPDGISLVMLSKVYEYKLKERVRGTTLMLEFLNLAEKNNYSNFFYGSTQDALNLMIKNLRIKFPDIKIVGTYSPPFRELSEEEDKKIIEIINSASADVIWVSLGCPKQQIWMHNHKNKLKVSVMVGVGAAFDFVAGTKLQAPSWIRDIGFEWFFRLITEPRRLWKRYLVGISLFICLYFKETIKERILKKISKK